LANNFHENFPNLPIACEAAEESAFFGRQFDGIIFSGTHVPSIRGNAKKDDQQNVISAETPWKVSIYRDLQRTYLE